MHSRVRAQGLVEYAVILSLAVVLAIAGLMVFGSGFVTFLGSLTSVVLNSGLNAP